MKAAVLYEPNTPLQVEEVTLDEPQGHEVLVRVVASVTSVKYLAIHGGCRVPDPTPGASHSPQVSRRRRLTLTEASQLTDNCLTRH